MSREQNKYYQAGNKRPKSYYKKCANQKKAKRNVLEVGMRGFIVTCNFHEKQTVMEAYNILNEYADILYGPEQFQSDKEGAASSSADDKVGSEDEDGQSEEEDIDKALDQEVKALKETKPSERRFKSVTSGAKNCIFIATSLDKPSDLAHYILTDFAANKVQKARFAARLLPIQVTCQAKLEDIIKTAEELLDPYFRTPFGTSHTFSVLFKARNNSTVSREAVVPKLGSLMKEMNPLNSCSYDQPDYLVLVEIICNVCCLGVVKDFYKLRKYNLHEVTVTKDPAAAQAIQDESTYKDTTQKDMKHKDMLQDTMQGDTLQEDTIHGDILLEDTIQGDTLQEDTIKGDTL